MKRTICQSCLLLLVLGINCVAALAQGRPFGGPPRPGGGLGPPSGTPGYTLLSSEMLTGSKLVKGAPFSATALTESTQVLPDGTHITRKMTASFARDNEGRWRREHQLNSIGPLPIAGEPPHIIFIQDVVAGVQYVLNVNEKLARKVVRPQNAAAPATPETPPGSTTKTEALGKQNIEGLEAVGTRTTITLPANSIGNDRPLLIVSERWESPELQLVLLSIHRDPRIGETVFRLTNLTRNEPARALFEVPSDYKIVQGGPPSNAPGGPPWQRGRSPQDF